MPVYLALLRGINVSGQKKVPMADLKVLFEKLRFKNVRTYIQSGNVVFETAKASENTLSKKIEVEIKNKFSFDVPILVRTPQDLENSIKENPFIKEKGIDTERLHVTFLESIPAEEHIKKLSGLSFDPDRFIIKEKVVYLHCPVSYGNSKLNNNFFESKLKVKATTRNWKTINVLSGMMKEE